MTSKRRCAEELLGQSLYEDLSPADRAELDALLRANPALRAEADDLRNFVGRIAAAPATLTGDLRPAIIAELARRPTRGAVFLPRWFLAASAFAMVASGVGYWIVMHPPAAVAPGLTLAADPAPSAPSPAFAKADALIADRQYAQAYTALADAIHSAPRSRDAAIACQKMAELAYTELQWYPEAFAHYDRLRRDYSGQFRADENNFVRLNLLDEARGAAGDYASLRALDVARREGTFEAYEKILAKYPATYVASAAAGEIATVVARAEGLDSDTYSTARALRLAQIRATDPIARQQLRIEVAHALRADPAQADEARRLYQEIANGPVTTLAELAKKSLGAMDEAPAASDPGL